MGIIPVFNTSIATDSHFFRRSSLQFRFLSGGIEEGVELSGLADISDLLPLGGSRVNTGGVMGAGVEKNAGSWGGVVQVSEHAVDIETLGLFVEVSVFAD